MKNQRKGAIGLTIMLLMLVFAFGLYLWKPITFGPTFTSMSSSYNSSLTQTVYNTSQSSGTQAGTSFFPNQWLIFADIFKSLFTFIGYPIFIWGMVGLPTPLTLFLQAVFGLLYGIAVLSFFRNGEL